MKEVSLNHKKLTNISEESRVQIHVQNTVVYEKETMHTCAICFDFNLLH